MRRREGGKSESGNRYKYWRVRTDPVGLNCTPFFYTYTFKMCLHCCCCCCSFVCLLCCVYFLRVFVFFPNPVFFQLLWSTFSNQIYRPCFCERKKSVLGKSTTTGQQRVFSTSYTKRIKIYVDINRQNATVKSLYI